MDTAVLQQRILIMGVAVMTLMWRPAFAQWNEITQAETDRDLRSVFFINDTHGWIAGINSIMYTINGGEDWELNEYPGFGFEINDFTSVYFIDPSTGWTGGRGNTSATASMRTTSGGVQWIENSFKGPSGILDIQFVDSDYGWMLVTGYDVLRTIDGGETWTEHDINPPSGGEIFDVHFIDRNHGWLVGWDGVIMHTDDGGQTWIEQQSMTNAELHRVHFVDADYGWAVGTNGAIFHTTNGGAQWLPQTNIPALSANNFFAVSFINRNVGWIGGDVFLGTQDGGLTWTVDPAIPSGFWVNDLMMINSNRGWAVGKDGKVFEYSDPNGGEASVAGHTFYDIDADCVLSDGDAPLARRIIEITPGPHYAISLNDGSYATRLEPGNYTVETRLPDGWIQPCPINSYAVAIPMPDDVSEANDFAQEPLALRSELRVDIAQGRMRPGFEFAYKIFFEDVGTLPFSGAIAFTYDTTLEFISSDPPAAQQVGATLRWDLEDIPIGSFASLTVNMRVPPDIGLLGQVVCAEAETAPAQGSIGAQPTFTIFCDTIRGSYDPNAITSFPRGEGIEGIITPEDTVLEYTIFFQNTGTDTAFTVRLLDTLTPLLDIPSLQFGASSHPYTVELIDSDILKFTFDNIQLPDSNVNEKASNGFVKYQARIHRSTPWETPIPNRAAIYFDYNPAVITNTVNNEIRQEIVSVADDPIHQAIETYPNPASDALFVRSGDIGIRKLTLINALGREVATYNFGPSAQRRIDLTQFSAGMYTLRLETAHGVLTRSLAIAR